MCRADDQSEESDIQNREILPKTTQIAPAAFDSPMTIPSQVVRPRSTLSIVDMLFLATISTPCQGRQSSRSRRAFSGARLELHSTLQTHPKELPTILLQEGPKFPDHIIPLASFLFLETTAQISRRGIIGRQGLRGQPLPVHLERLWLSIIFQHKPHHSFSSLCLPARTMDKHKHKQFRNYI